MEQNNHFIIIAIPLNRPEIVDFLVPYSPAANSQPLTIIAQRPTLPARRAWLNGLCANNDPNVADLLAIDDPHTHLVPARTNQLVPLELLDEPDYLTRNLGGWAPIYFAVMDRPGDMASDPLLKHAEILGDYGARIHYFGALESQVAGRFAQELGEPLAEAACRLATVQYKPGRTRRDSAEILYGELASGNRCAENGRSPLPLTLLYDALMDDLVQIEIARRRAMFADDQILAGELADWQERQFAAHGLKLILKGEYIMGRHRRSTVLIAPELGVVIKQPAPEPFHEVRLADRHYQGKAENWPYLTEDGAFVTSRGRLRLILAQNLVPQLYRACDHPAQFSTVFGLIIEPHVAGKTVQQAVLDDYSLLTEDLYAQFVLHQQVCEHLGIDNADWHSANFIIDAPNKRIVHVDWGAARPLESQDLTDDRRRARLNQVKNIAFSFHNEEISRRVNMLHEALIADPARLQAIYREADILSKGIS